MHPRVEIFLLNQPEFLQSVLFPIREIILSAAPGIEEKFSYGTPFYYYHGPLLYVSGKNENSYLGFVDGKRLDQDLSWLSGDHLKQIRHFSIFPWDESNEEQLRFLLQEAIALRLKDVQLKGKKKKK
jgi:hypothetical protein